MEIIRLEDRISRGYKGLSIVVGSGMLMATMDLIQTCGYFIEYKNIVDFQDINKVVMIGASADFIFVNAWFSISKPSNLLYMLQYFDSDKIYHYLNIEYNRGHKFKSLKESEILNLFYNENFTPHIKEKMV